MDILEVAKRNQQRAWEVIMDTDIIRIWEGIGAEVNLVGSLSTGLLIFIFILSLWKSLIVFGQCLNWRRIHP